MYSEAVKGDNSFLIGAYYYYCSLCLFIWPETALATREKSLPPPLAISVYFLCKQMIPNVDFVRQVRRSWVISTGGTGTTLTGRTMIPPRVYAPTWSSSHHWRSQKFYKGGRGRDRGDSLHIFFFFFKMSLKKKSVRIVMWIRICIMGDLLDPYTGGKILPKMCQKSKLGGGGHRPWCPFPLATPVTASAHSVISLLGSVSDLWFVFKKKFPKS